MSGLGQAALTVMCLELVLRAELVVFPTLHGQPSWPSVQAVTFIMAKLVLSISVYALVMNNRFTVTRVTIFSPPPQAGCLLLCSWGSQLLVSVLFPRTICPPQEPWVIKTVTLSLPGGAHEEQFAFSSGKPISQFAL